MRDDSHRPAAPNFTNACIVMFGVNLAWILMLVWAVWGLIAAAGLSWALNRLIARIEAARQG